MILFFRILLLFFMLQLIYYINVKFQMYQDIFVAQERHRIKRKSNDSENLENLQMKQNRTKLEEEERYKRKQKFTSSAEKNEGIYSKSSLPGIIVIIYRRRTSPKLYSNV